MAQRPPDRRAAPVVAAKRPDLLVSSDDTYCSGPWSVETFFAIATREGTSVAAIEIMREIAQWAGSVGLGPSWQRNPKPKFDVKHQDHGPYFTVWSDGDSGLPVVKRLAAASVPSVLLRT